jgi:glycerol-3-phosphate cytidylyltransferase
MKMLRQCDYLMPLYKLIPLLTAQRKTDRHKVVERYIQLKGCIHVDEIVPYATEQDLEDILRSFKIDVRIIGDEYQNKILQVAAIVRKRNSVAFQYARSSFSSSSLRGLRKVTEYTRLTVFISL